MSNRRPDPILRLRPTTENEAAQRLSQDSSEDLDVSSHIVTAHRFGHDFSSISVFPVYGAAPKTIQSKLAISAPGDRDEQLADEVAEKVMRAPDDENSGSLEATLRTNTATPQPPCQNCGESRQLKLQGSWTTSDTEEVDGRIESEALSLQGGGSPLPDSSRAFFESRFQHNFADVRVHTDARAAQLARGVNARAFTLGRNIVLGSGEYAPGTREGKRLLAHELAHVVQQERVQPHIQRLTINPKGRSKGKCGQYYVGWAFVLNNPAPDDGYIVQQIDKSEWVMNCGESGAPAPLPTYWEAWFVEKDHKRDWITRDTGVTDESTLDTPKPNTTGTLDSTGTVKFFTKSTTGDLDTNWTQRVPGLWGCVSPREPLVPESGDIPSTYNQPTWWNNPPVEGPKQRSVSVSWNCCDPDETKHTFDATATP
jgi:uncharacterized protein DUF4157